MGPLLSCGVCNKSERKSGELLGVFSGVFPAKGCGKVKRRTPRTFPGRESPARHAGASQLLHDDDDDNTRPNIGGFAETSTTDR
jgi:hypothetical protein